ncbi:MAG: universal stress protein [Pseudomonadota bacterium]|nr:universal stress protein [Pseudomonadota bacterium]
MDAIDIILAPTDLSESSVTGVRYALDLAATVKASVIIFHVASYEDEFPYPIGIGDVPAAYVPPQSFDDYMRDSKQALERFVEAHFASQTGNLEVTLDLDVGNADTLIVEKADQAGANLIVMATHGRKGLEHMLIGSVTEHVVRRARCPVLSVRVT